MRLNQWNFPGAPCSLRCQPPRRQAARRAESGHEERAGDKRQWRSRRIMALCLAAAEDSPRSPGPIRRAPALGASSRPR